MIARKSALIIATYLANGLLGFIGLKFIALYMEPWEYGVVGFAFGFVSLFSLFGQLGFDQAHIKRVSEGKDLGTCVATFALTKAILAGLMASLVIGAIALWKYAAGGTFETSLHEQAVYVMLSYFVVSTLGQSMSFTFNAKKEIAKSQLPYFVYTLVRIIATVIVAYSGLGVLALAYTYLLGSICSFALSLFFFKGYPVGRPSMAYFKSYLSFALPMAIASASWIIITNIDKVFIQLFWSATQVGEYFAVFNLSQFLILFVTAVGTLLFPTISEYHAQNNSKEIRKLMLLAERYLSMIVFPIVILMVVLAEPVIHILLSDMYMPALSVLQILPLFVLLEALARPSTTLLSAMNRPQIVRNRVLLMMLTNVALDLLLIPQRVPGFDRSLPGLGATGAAIATVISFIVGLFYAKVTAWKVTGFTGYSKIGIHALATLISGSALFYLNIHIFIARWYELLVIGLFGFTVYFIILFLMKEFTKADFHFFIDTLNVIKMIKYIKEETRINR